MALPPKVCPRCREEYLHSVSVCVHCDVTLVLAGELVEASEPGLPPSSELHCLRACDGGWAVALSELLREAGIPHRVDRVASSPEGGRHAYAVWIRRDDLERARPIDEAHAARQVPDFPEDVDAEYREAELHEGGDQACPACGERVEPHHDECSGCGLFLGGGE